MSPRNGAETDSLKSRLAEAEETLAAIRNGEVDALMIRGPEGEQLYTLRGSDAGYRAMVEQMQEGALTVHSTGLVIYCNRRFAEMVGVSHGEVVGSQLSRFLPLEPSSLEELLSQESIPRLEMLLRSASGTSLPVQVAFSPLVIDEDARHHVMVVTDLTDLRQKEESREAERLTRSILDNTLEAIVVCDREGCVIHANQAAQQLAGGDIRGLQLFDVVPFETKLRQRLLATAAGGPPVRVEPVTLGHGDDAAISLLVSAGPLNGRQGQPAGCVVSLVDDSFRHRAESELRLLNDTLEQRVLERTVVVQQQGRQLRALACELARAEQKERARLGQILHDHLQQLLVAAGLKAGRLRRHNLNGTSQEAVQQIEELLRQAIQASRDLTIELSPPILSEAGIGTALRWLGRQMQERHSLLVEIDSPEEAPASLEGIGLFLFNAARELLLNVVKHAGVLRARMEMKVEDDVVRLSVEDGGRGFHQTEEAIDARGVGLFGIRDRLELLGGKLEVRSRPGEGSCVTLEVPLSAAAEPVTLHGGFPLKPMPSLAVISPAEETPDEALSTRGRRPLRILLADDHTILRQGLASLLANEPDMEAVAEASNGMEALELTRLLRPDVIVMDASMPEMSGLEATRQIMERYPGTVVVGLSMYDSEDMADAMRAAGARAYVSKEKASEELCSVIRAAMSDGATPRPTRSGGKSRKQPSTLP